VVQPFPDAFGDWPATAISYLQTLLNRALLDLAPDEKQATDLVDRFQCLAVR